MWILLSEKLNRRQQKKWFLDLIDFENIYMASWVLMLIFSFFVWLVFVFYNYFFISNFDKLTSIVLDYNKNNVIINWDWKEFKWLNFQEKFLKDTEITVKKISEDRQKDLVWKLNFALPDVLEKEFVIKFFEDLFLTISTKNSPIVLNSINISSPSSKTLKIWRTWGVSYKKYPISLWFSCSDKEFDRILDIIQVSWLFDKRYYFRWEILPVMTVSSVAMNFDKNVDNADEYELKSRSLHLFMYSYWDKWSELKK